MAEALQDLGDHIAAKLGAAITGATHAYGELTLEAKAAEIVRVLTFLRDDPDCGFVCFIDICGADYPDREQRFDVVYHLLSPYKNRRIRVKVRTDEETPVPTAIPVFPAANWYRARNLRPLRRAVLRPPGPPPHPHRLRFRRPPAAQGLPAHRPVEVRYDDEAKRVVYEPVKLVQEFRTFDYLSPWEGTDYVLPGDEKAKQ